MVGDTRPTVPVYTVIATICVLFLLIECSSTPTKSSCKFFDHEVRSNGSNATGPCNDEAISDGSEDSSKEFYRHEVEVAEMKRNLTKLHRDQIFLIQTNAVNNNSMSAESMIKESETVTILNCGGPRACIPICCPAFNQLINRTCTDVGQEFQFTNQVYHPKTHELLPGRKVDRNTFDLVVNDPCPDGEKYSLTPDIFEQDEYKLLDNGHVYKVYTDETVDQLGYCFGVIDGEKYDVIVCFEEDESEPIEVAFPVGLIISVPFLFATFLVYTLIPELSNMHGSTLRCYVGSLLIAYAVLASVQITPIANISDDLCIVLAFTIHFSFLSSFFWLNVMCFDIWWTFGGFRSLQGSAKQRERKKFIIYSIYAWGSAMLLTGVCAIMDFVPSVPRHFIKPQFGLERCWFTTDAAKAIYFYGPMGVTVVCNICLFISTALKILQHKKDTAHHLKGKDSKRHDDNKQWFNLYLKLFIVMGINWSMEIVSWLFKGTPQYVWYITDLTNTLQGLIIFLIFVWKDKIRRLLLKKFGCQGRDVLSRNSTRSAYHSSASRTCTTSAAPLQEKINPYVTENSYRNKLNVDDSDCV